MKKKKANTKEKHDAACDGVIDARDALQRQEIVQLQFAIVICCCHSEKGEDEDEGKRDNNKPVSS